LLSSRECAYIGALGPAHRRRWLLDEVDRSPNGIAVAIAAEILASINSRSAQPLADCLTA
jgi:xanthine/CO dehydrogenase XdhC/CoxF family maturation factor